MIDQGTPKKTRVAVIPQLARVDWLHYALIGGRIVCGIWLLIFLWYGWGAWGEYRALSAAVSPDGAASGAFVRLEGRFAFPESGGTVASTSRKFVLFQGVEKDCGVSSFWSAHLKMYKIPRRGGPFAGKSVNLDTHLVRLFMIHPASGKPALVEGTPSRMYGTTFLYRFDPPFLSEHLDAGPNLEVEVLTASSGFVLGLLKRGEKIDRIIPHPDHGSIFGGLPYAQISRTLLLRFALSCMCVGFLALVVNRTRQYACLDRALERPAQFCVFESTGGSEMVGTVGIFIASFFGLMLLNPPGEVDSATAFYLHCGVGLIMTGLVMSASRVEFFFVANKADGVLYTVSRGILSSGITRVMKLEEFNPKASFEDVMTRHGERTSYYLETPTPDGGTLCVSDSYRDSVGPAEMLSEYERFQKTEMTQTPVDIKRLLG